MTAPRSLLNYGFKINLTEVPQADSKEKKDLQPKYDFYVDPPKKTKVSLKGGGVRVFLYRKFLEIADERGLWADVKEVGGSSSAAGVAAFAALPYENPKKRTEALEHIFQGDGQDLLAESHDSKNNFQPKNKFLRFATSVFNLLVKGGIYRGEKINKRMREQVRGDVEKALHAYLNRLANPQEKAAITQHLQKIQLINEQLVVTENLAFQHLEALADLPGSQFKRFYTAGVGIKDKKLSIYNSDETPNMLLSLAYWVAMSFPKFYQLPVVTKEQFVNASAADNTPKKQKVFDGGGLDNSPVRLAIRDRALPREIDDLTRLAVRVEYQEEWRNLLWEKLHLNKGLKFILKSWGLSLFSFGVDSLAAREDERKAARGRFEQGTLQLPDFGIGRMEMSLTPQQREYYCNDAMIPDAHPPKHPELKEQLTLPQHINRYFNQHLGEKLLLKPFQQSLVDKNDEKLIVSFPNNLDELIFIEFYLDRMSSDDLKLVDAKFLSEKEKVLKQKALQRHELLKHEKSLSTESLKKLDQLDDDIQTLRYELKACQLALLMKDQSITRDYLRPQIKILLFEFLTNPAVKTEDIFSIPCKTASEELPPQLEQIRQAEIAKLRTFAVIQAWEKQRNAKPSTPSTMTTVFRRTQPDRRKPFAWELGEAKKPAKEIANPGKPLLPQPIVNVDLTLESTSLRA